MHRRHAACRADGADAVFERREPLFQHRGRRIGNPRVDVAGALQIEQTGGVIGVVEHIGGGLIDRDGARARDRIGMLTGMHAQGLEGGRFRGGHELVTSLGGQCEEARISEHANFNSVEPLTTTLVRAAPLESPPPR